MSNLNLQWVNENFPGELNFFNIGCADLTDDSLRFSLALPNHKIYSFDAADTWIKSNQEKAKLYDLHFEAKAVSFFDGPAYFYNTDPCHDLWQYTGQLINKTLIKPNEKYILSTVDVISLNSYCQQHQIVPHFLHIDAEHEEYNILKDLKEEFWPWAIWLEHDEFYHDGIGRLVGFDRLDQLLIDRGYKKIHQSLDVLYVKCPGGVSEYVEYQHYRHYDDVPISEHERKIQRAIWLKRYELCKDITWPRVSGPEEFSQLPDEIQGECISLFDLAPPKDIL